MKRKLLFAILLTVFLLTGCQNTKKDTVSHTDTDASLLSVHFIDVGQGDAILITCQSHAMLIDAGNNSKGTAVQLYLKKQGITKLDYVIATHPDADHIGGLDVILYKFHCEQIFMPDCQNNTTTYHEVMDVIRQKNLKHMQPKAGKQTYTLGSARFRIVGPLKKYENTNDNSLAVHLTNGENSFLFMGDSGEEAEQTMLKWHENLHAQVLKVAHHGSKYSTSTAFLKAVAPKYAIISCEENNSYGFPTAQTLNRLRSQKVQVFRTDEQGSIIATSNGSSISWNTSPSTSWKAGENTQHSTSTSHIIPDKQTNRKTNAALPKDITYVINKNTGKYHKPHCSAIKHMAKKNTLYSKKSADALEKEGYLPCKICHPD